MLGRMPDNEALAGAGLLGSGYGDVLWEPSAEVVEAGAGHRLPAVAGRAWRVLGEPGRPRGASVDALGARLPPALAVVGR